MLSVLALFGLLTFILWQAIPSTFWERISNGIEKRVLWAIIGLLILSLIGETAYLIQSYIQSRTSLRFFGSVLWNSNCDLFCPKDETPIYKAGRTINEDENSKVTVELFQCPKCDSNYILKDFDGNPITFAQAKKNFLIKQSLKTKGSIQAPIIEEGFDDVTIKVLKGFGGSKARLLHMENFTGLLESGTKPVQISHSLDILNKKGYLTRCSTQYVNQNILYELTSKGREYIVKNNLV